MREVIFLGLHPDVDVPRLLDLSKKAEIWTLNDWYLRFPAVTNPSRVYQVHEWFTVSAPCGRMPAGWRERYEWCGASIVTLNDMGFKKQRILDKKSLREKYGSGFFGSTFSYMFADCMSDGVSKVHMVGIRLSRHSEYSTQVPVTLYNIKIARDSGIEIVCPYENDWLARGSLIAPHSLNWMYGEAIDA